MKVGFIGVGNIGQPMAKQLLSNGFNLLVNDIHKENSLSLTNAGAIWVDNPEDLAKQCDFVCTCLPGPTQMEQLIIGPNGILNSMNEKCDKISPNDRVMQPLYIITKATI